MRRAAAGACVLAFGALFAAQAYAQGHGSMDSEQRERFRRELRQHDAQRADRGRGDDARRRTSPEDRRLSPDERERLREQVRQARTDESRRGAARR